MNLQETINSRFGIGAALLIAKIIPPRLGILLSKKAARFLASKKTSPMVQSVRANQWIVSNQTMNEEELDSITLKTFQHTAYCIYDLYHNMNKPQIIKERVQLSPSLVALLDQRVKCGEGTVIVAPHLSNFDLAGRAMALNGYRILALSYPQPKGGYQWQNDLRRDYGIDIIPMSFSALRTAKERLLDDEMILTGLDRPMPQSNYHPKFFGYPCNVPVTYAKIALQTNSKMIVVACVGKDDGDYVIDHSPLITLVHHADSVKELEINAESALAAAENFIRQRPHQWSMFFPVWPWSIEKMP